MKAPLPPLPVNAYYDSTRKSYLVQDEDGNWMSIDQRGLILRLNLAGKSGHKGEAKISPADVEMLRVQQERNVYYAGPLAGFNCGEHYVNSLKILVTHSPKLVKSVPGDWPMLRALIEGQWDKRLPDEIDQTTYFYAWIKLSDEQLEACVKRKEVTYGQALFMAGPKGCGKSLVQQLITEILGGRSAAPFGYMIGKTPFNRETFVGEHQMVEDEQPHKDYGKRVQFGDAIKQIAATTKHPCYGKNREAITLTPFWRLTLSVNDDPDHLEVLPPFDDSMLDKILLFSCRKVPMPMPAATASEKAAFWKVLVSELPAFMHWIRNEFVIPESIRDLDNRYGVRAFFHPRIMAILSDIAPETKLLALIDQVIFGGSAPFWQGTAEDLVNVLCESVTYGAQAKRFVSSGMACGRLLGKLSRSREDRFTCNRQSDSRLWHIRRPAPAVVAATAQPLPEPIQFPAAG